MLNYSDLRDIQKREMESSAVVNLPDDFYKVISELLSQKQEQAKSSQSLLVIKEYENMKKIMMSVAMKREEKIVLMALRGEEEGNGLTSEEKEMLKELSSIIKRSRNNVKNVWNKEQPESEPQRQRIKLLKDVDQYRGSDDSVYGPFKQGDEKVLPIPEAQWLKKAGMAELL